MAQHDYNIANATFPATRTDINSVLSAINTSNSGTSRPSSAVEGTVWLDTTNATTPTLKFYDGSDDISLATLDYTANTVNWIDSTVVFDIVNDLSPELGGNLDLNSSDITGTGDINITGSVTATSFSGDGSALTGIETGTDWQSTIVTGTTLTAVANKGYWIDTTSNQCTVTFPASPSVGDTIELVDYARTWGTNSILIDSNTKNYQGSPDTDIVEYDTSGQALKVVYSGATQGWTPTSDEVSEDNPVTPSVNLDYLSVAGGAGGGLDAFQTNGTRAAGGGGAGGFLSGSTTITSTSGIAITVGAGGAGGSLGSEVGTNGSNSSIAFTSAITSIGGGGGGAHDIAGILNPNSGGSGGGGHQTGTGGAGTSGQGSNGRNGGSGNTAGVDGKSWSGNSTTYAGGGAGNTKTSFHGGGGGGASGGTVTQSDYTGGLGGGGASSGTSQNTTGTAGTTNTGSGGGGGSGTAYAGGAGGSGIVIIKYSGTTTKATGGTITTSGGNTFHTFTSSGTFTYLGV